MMRTKTHLHRVGYQSQEVSASRSSWYSPYFVSLLDFLLLKGEYFYLSACRESVKDSSL